MIASRTGVDGRNRWFDKSFTVICFENGCAAAVAAAAVAANTANTAANTAANTDAAAAATTTTTTSPVFRRGGLNAEHTPVDAMTIVSIFLRVLERVRKLASSQVRQ